MILDHPKKLIAISIVMLILGFVLPFLMAIKVLDSTLFLNFFSYVMQVLGLLLGIAGVTVLKAKQGKKHDDDDLYR